MLVAATAYRMLTRWKEHEVRKDDVVLVWGGAGGLGSMAIQICKAHGAKVIAVVSEGDDTIGAEADEVLTLVIEDDDA
jgi:crotonyl-CoA carboxylase/reductase